MKKIFSLTLLLLSLSLSAQAKQLTVAITTAGVSAGIDGALHLVVRLFGIEIAKKAVAGMEYDWNP